MTDRPEATPVTDAEREIGRAVFQEIERLRALSTLRTWPQQMLLRGLEAIVLAVTGEKA
jgi:hypothetical protein